MNKEQIKKLTLKDLIAKREQVLESKKKFANIYIESLGGYIVVEKPDRALIADALEIEDGMESNIHLAYNSIIEPKLSDKEVMEAYGVHTPKELVQVLLTDGEISDVAQELMKLAGYGGNGVKLVSDIKN